MGAAMAVAGPAMSLGGKALGIFGGIQEGKAKKAAAQIEAGKLMMAAEAGKVRAVQTDAAYRDEMNDVFNNISAIRSAQGVGFDSPTSFALIDKAQTTNDRARKIALSNERLKILGLEGDAGAVLERGRSAMSAALIGQAGKAFSLGQEAIGLIPK